MTPVLRGFWRFALALWAVTAVAVVVTGALLLAFWGRLTDASLRHLVITGALTGAVTTVVTIYLIERPMTAILSRIYRMIEGDFGGRLQAGAGGGILSRIMHGLDDLAGIEEQRRAIMSTAERRYRTLYEQSPAALYRTRLDGRIVDGNPAALRLLGYDSVLDATTRNAATYYADPADRADILARLAKHEVLCNVPLRFRRKDGSEVSVLLSAVRIEDLGETYVDGLIIDASTVHRV